MGKHVNKDKSILNKDTTYTKAKTNVKSGELESWPTKITF